MKLRKKQIKKSLSKQSTNFCNNKSIQLSKLTLAFLTLLNIRLEKSNKQQQQHDVSKIYKQVVQEWDKLTNKEKCDLFNQQQQQQQQEQQQLKEQQQQQQFTSECNKKLVNTQKNAIFCNNVETQTDIIQEIVTQEYTQLKYCNRKNVFMVNPFEIFIPNDLNIFKQ